MFKKNNFIRRKDINEAKINAIERLKVTVKTLLLLIDMRDKS